MGMGDDTICVNPSAAIVGGQYQYERASNQLIPLAAVSNPAPVPVSNPAAAAASNPAPAAEQPAAPPPPSDVVPVQNPEPPDTEGF